MRADKVKLRQLQQPTYRQPRVLVMYMSTCNVCLLMLCLAPLDEVLHDDFDTTEPAHTSCTPFIVHLQQLMRNKFVFTSNFIFSKDKYYGSTVSSLTFSCNL